MPTDPPIALFVTCLVDQVLPEIGIATVALLERAGFAVVFPEQQTCCGQPFANSGFRDEARRLAKRTIEIFEPYEAVVLPSGSCTAMLRHDYAGLFADEPAWAARAEKLAARTFELTEFLAHSPIHLRAAEGRTIDHSTSSPVTYHDSCHMCRTLGVREEPRRALKEAGAEIVEMEESDRCCGFGGLFSLHMPEVSEAMTAAKLQNAAVSGAPTLVTADPGCLMQMRRFAEDGGLRLEHIAVILEELTR